jgi:hypothetical protein
MAKFNLRDRVMRIGVQELRTVEEIREGQGEPMYWIQLGSDFATRVWAKETELELAPRNRVKAVAYDYEHEKHIHEKK